MRNKDGKAAASVDLETRKRKLESQMSQIKWP